MNTKILKFLCFILASFLAIMLLYIELQIILAMDNFEEPSYVLPLYHLEFKGVTATLAHLINFGLAMAAVVIAISCYQGFRDK